MKGTETAIGSDERCALAAVIIFAKHGKELLACVLTAGMGVEHGVIFQV